MEFNLRAGLKFKKIDYHKEDWKREFILLWKDDEWYAVFPNHYIQLIKVDLRNYYCDSSNSLLEERRANEKENVDPQK